MTAPDDSAREKILAALRAYHGGNIYLMGSRQLVAAGFDLHHENETASIEWGKNFSCLHVRIGRAGRVVVNVRLKEDQLAFSCTCSLKSKEGGCEHAICAVLTLKNLLMPGVFKPKQPDPAYRKSLLAGLIGSSPEKLKKAAFAGYAVVLEQKDNGDPDVYVAMSGERLTKLADLLQAPLIEFAAPDLHFHQKIDALMRYLKRNGNKYPIIVKSGGEDTEAIFDPGLPLETFTELALSGEEVSVVKGLRDQDKRAVRFVLFNELVYLPDSEKLTVVENIRGWETWRRFNREMVEAGLDNDDGVEGRSLHFSVPLAVFDRFPLTHSAGKDGTENEDVLFTLNGKKARPALAAFEQRLTIMLPEDGSHPAILRADCAYGDYSGPVNYSCFRFFEDLNLLPQYLKAGNRKEALVRAFFELMDAATGAQEEKIIKAALNDGDVVKSDMRNDCRRLLLRYRNEHAADIAHVLVQDGQWRSAHHDREREALLFKVSYEVFGRRIFDDMEQANAMRVPADLLYERLPLLCERLSNLGIKLYLKEKPVRQSRGEFTINAVQKTDIDWFEIRPEIRFDGRVLDGVSMEALFAGRGVVERDEFIQILDSNGHQILERIAAAYRAADGRGGSEREMVRVPRLRILDWAALRNRGVTVRLSREDEKIVERLLNFDRIEKKPRPKGLQATLRPYQRQGYSWLAFLYEHRLGACLADDMGLGKTVQAITLLGGIKEGIVQSPRGAEEFPHLIVVPPSLVFNWEQEINKFYPGLKVHIYSGSERSDDFDKAGVVVTTYGTVRMDVEKLKERRFHVVIFDEAQAVKNLYAETTGAVRQLNALFKLTMTGTPVENHLGEYYSIVDLAIPGLLGEYDRFRPLIKSEGSADLDVIIRRTRPFVLRRTKEAVLADLPPKTETDIYLDLTEEQKALYQKTVEQVRSTVDEAYRMKTQAQAKIITLTAILKLRQICITPQLVNPELSSVSPKMDFLIDQLGELMEENHGALVFSQFTSFLDILGETLKKNGLTYLRLDGSTPMQKRKTLVKQFQSGEGPAVFLLSLKAGGQGLNLTRASYVFHLDPWWNPAVENQASDRAHRIGQQNKVTITRLLMRHTLEEKMMELKKRKRALFEAIVNDSDRAKPSADITRSDFDFLLGQS